MTWFRRGQNQSASAEADAAELAKDTPDGLRWALFAMNRYINQNSGRLPGEGVVLARRLTDTLREIVDTSQTRPLDMYTIVTIRSTLEDYLPTTLKAYLSLDDEVLAAPVAAGTTPAQLLIAQLNVLQESIDGLLVAVRDQDANSLVSQGNFLQTKFSRSDLDL